MELFKSVMWQYIQEEPQLLKDNINREDIVDLANQLVNYKEIYFISHGSSYNAAVTVAPFFRKYTKLQVHCMTPGELLSSNDIVTLLNKDNTLVILISQTGNSRGTLQAAQLAKKHSIKTLGLSADNGATLKQYTDYFLTLNCGPENSNAKTKGMSCTILVLLLLATHLAHIKHHIDPQTKQEIITELNDQVSLLVKQYEQIIQYCHNNSFGKNLNELYIIGSNMNYGLALEAQIKIMETMCIPTCAVNAEEFSHGTHRAIKNNSSLLLIKTPDNNNLVQTTYDYFNDKSHIYMIDTVDNSTNCNIFPIPYFKHTESALLIVQFIQIISAYGPEYSHLDPNRDANNRFTELVDTRI